MRFIVIIVIAAFSATACAQAGAGYPPRMPGATEVAYKTVGGAKLNLWVFNPEGHKQADSRPAIVFFFGGGWQSGSPAQFEPQCRYLASRGMVAITADYRVASRQNAKPVQCIADAKSAIRHVRSHAKEMGIDPKRIAAGGGSAGGHLAGAIATVPGFDETGEDTAVTCVPDALVLFNPALVLAPFGGKDFGGFGARVSPERLGARGEDVSPVHHVKAGTPPAIIFHGKADATVPFITAEVFCSEMKKAGNRCELFGYEGQPHGFFNLGRGGSAMFRATLSETDKFLASLGWLGGAPTVDEFFKN